jgi:hypothetical protein
MSLLNQMPDDAKLWVYQSNRFLTDTEVAAILSEGEKFIASWAAHGSPLKASFDVVHSLFIVIAVDEKQAQASGCSIDKSVHFVKQLEQQFNITLFDRFRVAFFSGDTVNHCSYHKLADVLEQHFGSDYENVTVFNNTITSKTEFDTNWKIPLKESWMNKVLEA